MLPVETVERAWPSDKERLLRDGEKAQLFDLRSGLSRRPDPSHEEHLMTHSVPHSRRAYRTLEAEVARLKTSVRECASASISMIYALVQSESRDDLVRVLEDGLEETTSEARAGAGGRMMADLLNLLTSPEEPTDGHEA